MGKLRGATPPGNASTHHISSNTVCFNPLCASAQTRHRRGTIPRWWQEATFSTTGASPQPEKHSQKSKLVGDGGVGITQGDPGDVSSAETEHSAPSVPLPGRARTDPAVGGFNTCGSEGSWGDPARAAASLKQDWQDQATGPRCCQLGHDPWSLGDKDANASGRGRSSANTFAPAAEGCVPASPSLAAPGEALLPAQATSDGDGLTRR